MIASSKNPAPLYREYAISTWLLGICVMVFAMVVIGGLTRLTESGLSMVDWRPVTGWLPPLSTAEWEQVFEGYKQIPEYQQVNAGMTLLEFKGIFWLEYLHRLWGRLIGVAYLIPFVFFWIRGWLSRTTIPMLLFLFILGGAQGVLGWYMVKSGLAERVDVSQYRLTAHLGLAVIIYVFTLRYALRIRQGYEAVRPVLNAGVRSVRKGIVILGVLVFVTILSGGFMAGLDAGKSYNTFPLMDGRVIPGDLYNFSPVYLSAFEHRITVQFHHRFLALFTLTCTIIFWFLSLSVHLTPQQRFAYGLVLIAGGAQVALGIATLILGVPVYLAALHQAGSIIFLSAIVYALHTLEWGNSVFKAP